MNTAQRLHLVSLMGFLVRHKADVHYAQVRPMRTVRLTEQEMRKVIYHGPNPGVTMDCSEAVTCLCRWALTDDPNGLHYNGYGFTGTLLHHLPHYTDPRGARPGALVVFGPGNGDHVAMVYEPGEDPLLFSHGSEAGPILIRLSVERTYHRAPVTFLDVHAL